MQLFYWVNGAAGRMAWVDSAARFFYVAALPLLACGLLWLLLLAPRSWRAMSSRRIFGAGAVAMLGAFLMWQGIEWSVQEAWGTSIFSPRPFVTHRVNLLVAEPNDNSYPCIEVLLSALLATLCWATSLRAGGIAWAWTILYGLARVFCGANYPIDVMAGWLLGWALSAFSLAVWRAPLRLPARDGGRLKWRRRHQAVMSLGSIALVLGAAIVEMLGSPQALRHGRPLLSGRHANAAPAFPGATFAAGASTSIPTSDANGLPLDGRYGRQPRVEKIIARRLEGLRLAHEVAEIEVAQITVGSSIFRVACVMFHVQPDRPRERAEVSKSAARIARAVFEADPQTQNVDVLGVIFSDKFDKTRGISRGPSAPVGESFGEGAGGGASTEAPKPLPVFTVSIQRQDLVLEDAPSWANARGVDDGLWLRARSRLFIDLSVLPRPIKPIPTPTAVPTAAPTPTTVPTSIPTPVPTAAPTSKPTPKPTAKPTARSTPSPVPTSALTPIPRPIAKPIARPTSRPTPRAVAPIQKPIRKVAPRPRRKYLGRRVIRRRVAPQRVAPRRKVVRKYLRRTKRTYRRYNRRRRS